VRILVIEDEKKVARFIQRGLQEEMYTVDVAHDGERGEFLASTEDYDAIVLDILLPKRDGLTVLRNLRQLGVATPILMLTAKSDVSDRVVGLDSGADDYLPKPFAFSELVARVRALIRRGSLEKSTVHKIGDLELDTVTHVAKRGDKSITLTGKEYSLLEYFMRNKNRVLTRTEIAEHIWSYNFDSGTNVIDVYINHLRAKLEDGVGRTFIRTIRGVGYVMKEE